MKLRVFKITIYLVIAATVYLIFSNIQSPQNNLKKVVDKALEGSEGAYGIVVKSLKSGESYSTAEHQVFEAGSLYKVWIMAETFKQIQVGQLKEEDILSESIPKLNTKFNLASDSAELKVGSITLSVKDAINQMITISHNYAALLLTEKVKLSKVAQFLKENGFNESEVGIDGSAPKSTPLDIALFFEKLYKRELVNSQKMIELLKAQQLNDKLPKKLPKDVSIAHKTGETGYFTHDGGIVFTPRGDYIIVILSESDYPPGAEDIIAQISKSVYEYFDKR